MHLSSTHYHECYLLLCCRSAMLWSSLSSLNNEVCIHDSLVVGAHSIPRLLHTIRNLQTFSHKEGKDRPFANTFFCELFLIYCIPYEQKFWCEIKIGDLVDVYKIGKLKSCLINKAPIIILLKRLWLQKQSGVDDSYKLNNSIQEMIVLHVYGMTDL